MFRLSLFACCNFLFCDFNLCSHPGFDFLSVVYSGTLIFSQTNFAPAYIKSFSSVMFVGIFINRSLTLSVLDFTVLLSWFTRESNVVFFSDRILFMISTFIFSSRVSVCVVVFAVFLLLSFSVWV